jgi:hypothetical protein
LALVGCVLVALVGTPRMMAQESPAAAPTATFSTEELNQMLAPIALYPDALLAQIFMASTYPLEVVEEARWVEKNPNLKDAQLDAALENQKWDPSVKALAHFPQILALMNQNLEWTTNLGDAFLGQREEVMNTVQQLRAKAQATGNLKTTQEQQVIVEQQVIRIEPTNPQVIYVPAYNPTVVYGTWAYPAYPPPPIYYPGYYPGAAFAAGAITFGAGMVTGAALAGAFDWNHHDIDIDIDRNINVNRTNVNVQNRRTQVWQHDPAHRSGVAYRDRATSQRYGQTRPRDAVSSPAARGYPTSTRTGVGQQARQGGIAHSDSGVQRRESGALSGSSRVNQPSRPSSFERQTGGLDRSRSDAFSSLGDGGNARLASQRGAASRSGSFHGGGRGGFGGGRR